MFPEINKIRKASTNISVFRGLNRTVNTGFSRVSKSGSAYYAEPADMENLCGDDYPRLRTRKLRSRKADVQVRSNLLAAGGKLIYVTENSGGKLRVGADEYAITGYQNGYHQLTLYGNRVIVMPERLCFDFSTHVFNAIDFVHTSQTVSRTELNDATSNYRQTVGTHERAIRFRDFSIEKVELDDSGKPRTVNYIFDEASDLEDVVKQLQPGDDNATPTGWQQENKVKWYAIEKGETVEAQGESPSGVYRCVTAEYLDIPQSRKDSDGNGSITIDGISYKVYQCYWVKLMKVETPYVRIFRTDGSGNNLFAGVKKGDFVKISGMVHSVPDILSLVPFDADWGNYLDVLNNNTFKVYYADADSIVIMANIEKSVPYNGPMTISRVMPETDSGMMLEVSNRLWACSSANNEIYSCRQGDCTNWQAYGDAISTDSFAATVGNEGVFTGIARQNDSVIFFKENWIMKLFGNKPSNYALSSYNVPGVERGSEKSVVWVNGVLYYLSHIGVCRYSPGGQPVVISHAAFGDEKYKNGVGGRHRNKYYLSAQNESGAYELFAFDTDTGMWHREDSTHMADTVTYNNVLYYIDADTGALMCMDAENTLIGDGAEQEQRFVWSFETGNLYENDFGKKYISKIQLAIDAEEHMFAKIYAQFRYGGAWIELRALHRLLHRHSIVPVAVRRADFLKIRMEGTGRMELSGIQIDFAGGSSVTWQY